MRHLDSTPLRRHVVLFALALALGGVACGADSSVESADESDLTASGASAKRLLGSWTLDEDPVNAEVNARRLTAVVFFEKASERPTGKPARQFVRDHYGNGATQPDARVAGAYFLTDKNLTLRSWRSEAADDYFDDRYPYRFEGTGESERLVLGGGASKVAVLRRAPSYCVSQTTAADDCLEVAQSCESPAAWTCKSHACAASCGAAPAKKASGAECLTGADCASGTCNRGIAEYTCE